MKKTRVTIRINEKLKKAAAEKAAANDTTLTEILTDKLKNYINEKLQH